jgi:hypothetical protein
MWNWLTCYLSGHHEFGVWCEPGAVFLRCVHCGRRSSGWTLGNDEAPRRHKMGADGPAAPRLTVRARPDENIGPWPFPASAKKI